MKFENLMLASLFTVCLLICVLTMGSMLMSPAPGSSLAANQATSTTAG